MNVNWHTFHHLVDIIIFLLIIRQQQMSLKIIDLIKPWIRRVK